MVTPIPADRQHVSPYLVVDDPLEFLEFVRRVFQAEELHRTTHPNGHVLNLQVRIRDTVLLVSHARQGVPLTPSWLWLYVEDADAAHARALEAGAVSLMEPTDEFYGDRTAGVRDPAGITWWLNVRLENLSSSEIQRRFDDIAARSH